MVSSCSKNKSNSTFRNRQKGYHKARPTLDAENLESRTHIWWDLFGLIIPVMVPMCIWLKQYHGVACVHRRLMNASWKESSCVHHWKVGGQHVYLDFIALVFMIPSNELNGLLREDCYWFWRMLLFVYIIVSPSLCFWKSVLETDIPLCLWSLIYQPTPQRKNQILKSKQTKKLWL